MLFTVYGDGCLMNFTLVRGRLLRSPTQPHRTPARARAIRFSGARALQLPGAELLQFLYASRPLRTFHGYGASYSIYVVRMKVPRGERARMQPLTRARGPRLLTKPLQRRAHPPYARLCAALKPL